MTFRFVLIPAVALLLAGCGDLFLSGSGKPVSCLELKPVRNGVLTPCSETLAVLAE